jgi:hypothetical protein
MFDDSLTTEVDQDPASSLLRRPNNPQQPKYHIRKQFCTSCPANRAHPVLPSGRHAHSRAATSGQSPNRRPVDPVLRNETAYERDRSSPAMKMTQRRLCPDRSEEPTQVIENRLCALHFRKNPISVTREAPVVPLRVYQTKPPMSGTVHPRP